MSAFIAIAIVFTVGLPLWYAWQVCSLDAPPPAWAAAVTESAMIVAIILIVGRWDIAGIYTRWLLVALFGAAILRSAWRLSRRPGSKRGSVPRVRLVTIALLAVALGYILLGLRPPDDPVELAFPLRDGRFVVGQGGGNRLLNHHAGHPAQRYAADFTAVGAVGLRARGPLPSAPERYAVWGAQVVSPCDGEVVEARGDLPDLPPPRADPENPAGNHVVLDCDGLSVELAHLMRDSLVTAPGDRLTRGDPVGRVGNSGNTTEPHLHIHAYDPETGEGVPMTLDGRAPVRNRVYRR